MLLCKQEEAGFQLNAEQADWKDDTDDESDDPELEAHYMYMAKRQEVSPDAVDNSGLIFDSEPLQHVSNNDNYNVFAIESEHPEQSKSTHDTYLIEQDKHNVIIDSLDMSYDREQADQDDADALANAQLDTRNDVKYASKVEIDCAKAKGDLISYKMESEKSFRAYTQKINDLNQTLSEMKKELCAHQETISTLTQQKEAQIKLYKSHEDKEIDKVIALENKVKLVEIILFIVDSECSKHMTGNLKLLINFVEKFLGKVKFRNDQIALILGYGDLVKGKITIKRVYYVKGLNHNLFSVDQFCDADLEVAFRKSTCYIRDLKGNDLLTGIEHQMSVAQTPEQNGVVKRWNRTLVEAAQTMLNAAKVPLFFWAEAIATTCFTQNRSLVIPRHEKTPYHIINNLKPSVKFFHIFGSLCYIVRDGENLDKMKEKGDACIFIGYSTQSRAYRMALDHASSDPVPQCQRTALEHVSLSPDLQCQENVPQTAETVITSNELDLLFSPMFDELLNGSTKVVSKYSAVTAADEPHQRQQHHTTPLKTQSTHDPTCQDPSQAPTVTSNENINEAKTISDNAQVEDDEFINIFYTSGQDRGETSSRHVDSSTMHAFYQRYPSEHRWTKDHSLEQVIGNPSQSVRTRRQLESDGEMCMFTLIVSQTELKNIKEAMADSAWIESMQEELHQLID
nr:integrase, catalytic region, zinc finger, CCHC-type, peptidase aspartic, catalytic [Tanacetum cinerariifolium]